QVSFGTSAVAIEYLLTHRPGGEDFGQQRHDRPRRGPPAVRGAGRFQVVCATPFRRLTKDGPIMNLLVAEITALTGRDPAERYAVLTAQFGKAYYTGIDAPATPEQKEKLSRLSADAVKASDAAGEPIMQKLTRAAGNDAPIGGLKVVTASGRRELPRQTAPAD